MRVAHRVVGAGWGHQLSGIVARGIRSSSPVHSEGATAVQRPGNVCLPTLGARWEREAAVTMDAVPVRPVARRAARLLIVDGEAIVRFGLRQLFAPDPDVTVVGEAASPRDALVIADRCPPDLV